jgi:hypothetical protein
VLHEGSVLLEGTLDTVQNSIRARDQCIWGASLCLTISNLLHSLFLTAASHILRDLTFDVPDGR